MSPDSETPPPLRSPDDLDAADVRERLDGIQETLRDIFYRLVAQRQRDTGLGGDARETTLNLGLKIAPPEQSQPPSDQLYRRILQAAHGAADRFAVFPPGHVYCHWCRSFACSHALPPESRSVFGGYSPTGQPTWREFASVALERGDPRVELLFRDQPVTIPLVQGGEELASQQLSVYGKRSSIYRILGQVVIGYLLPPRDRHPIRAPFAITFQAVEAASGRSPAILNVIGTLADGTPVFEALEESFDARLLDAVLTTRRRLSDISVARIPRRRRGREKRKRVRDILQRLAKNFERVYRQGRRRTHHSQDRHRNRRRPTSVAFSDALGATRESIFRDVEEHTWVVLGPKNRVHVFNDQAAHVTSVVYPGETVRHRTTKGKWLTPTQEQLAGFLDALRRRTREE